MDITSKWLRKTIVHFEESNSVAESATSQKSRARTEKH